MSHSWTNGSDVARTCSDAASSAAFVRIRQALCQQLKAVLGRQLIRAQ